MARTPGLSVRLKLTLSYVGFLMLTVALLAAAAWVFFLKKPEWADALARGLAPLRTLLVNKYYFDWFNENVVCALVRGLGKGLWRGGDQILIDGGMVNGTANTVGWFGGLLRHLQSGYLYTYAFWTMIGLALLLGWFLVR